MGSTTGLILMLAMRQLFIKEMDFPDVSTVIGPLFASEKSLLCVEGFRHLVLYILGLTLSKNIKKLVVTLQSVQVIQIPNCILIHKLQG